MSTQSPHSYLRTYINSIHNSSTISEVDRFLAKFTYEQFATSNQSTAGRFDRRVFVNCLQIKNCCERRLFIWLQSGDVTNACVNKVNTMIGCGTKTEVTLVEGVIG